MLVQIGLECKSFVTSYAYKRFGVGVGLDVSTQIRLVGKSLVANVTTKWFFPCTKKKRKIIFMPAVLGQTLFTCMGTYMALQQPWTGEAFSAKWTLASLVMSSDVHRVGGHGDVSFLTMWTFASFLILEGPKEDKKGRRSISHNIVVQL